MWSGHYVWWSDGGNVGDSVARRPQAESRGDYCFGRCYRVHDTIHKKSGSVHACAVFEREGEHGVKLLHFIEDVGRHNAVDSISGLMWLANKPGKELITTGRLTSEMVIKGAQIGIPFLFTRSGVTLMGLELARKTNLAILSRCSGKHFEIYNAPERVVFTQNIQ